MKIHLALAFAALACGVHPALAAESYEGCRGFVTSLPAVITQQGVWCLTGDLSTSIDQGVAVRIDANNVTLDCNGFKIGGLGGGPMSFASGVLSYDRHNVVVRNCNVRGFAEGIYLYGAGGGHLVEDNRVEGIRHVSVLARGGQSLVRRNIVRDAVGVEGGHAYSFGVVVEGDALDNTVDVVHNQAAIGIGLYGRGSVARGNVIRGVMAAGIGAPLEVNDADAVLEGNVIHTELAVTQAIQGPAEAMAVCRGNITIGFTRGFDDCTDAGGNFNR